MKVLLGCEESGTGREAFRKLGHDAWSCDLLPARDGSPYHLQMDIFEALKMPWDLILLFPPCTYTCLSGNGTWAGTPERQQGMEFTYHCWEAAKATGAKVCLEQPMTMVGKMLGKPTQKVNLWWFGDPETKETWLWQHNCGPLFADNPTEERKPVVHYESPGVKNGLTRSQRRQTLRPGFARALAEQFGGTC
jgi:hypothetical protein